MHQGFNLGGTSVNFKQRDSLVIDFRTSKSEGQSNFVNPGAFIVGYGLDADVTPKLKAFMNVNYIWTMETEVTKQVLFTNHAEQRYRTGLQSGISMAAAADRERNPNCGHRVSRPGAGIQGYLSGEYTTGAGVSRAAGGDVDDFLYSGIFTITLTY